MSAPSSSTAIIPFTATPAAAANSPSAPHPPPQQSLPAAYISPVPQRFNPEDLIELNHVNSTDQKRKRGRPRKYGPEVGAPTPMAQPHMAAPTETQPPVDGSDSAAAKKARGRPRGSINKKQPKEAAGAYTTNRLTPHHVNVNPGEDISSRILTISQNGPGALCVLSASGQISTVTLRQAAVSGGTATYEGTFDITSLRGSFIKSEVGGHRSLTGGLSIALTGPDGKLLGGSVAGSLIAASPVRLVLGSFLYEGGSSSSASRGTAHSESSNGPAPQ